MVDNLDKMSNVLTIYPSKKKSYTSPLSIKKYKVEISPKPDFPSSGGTNLEMGNFHIDD
jgi:hypothetical protein